MYYFALDKNGNPLALIWQFQISSNLQILQPINSLALAKEG